MASERDVRPEEVSEARKVVRLAWRMLALEAETWTPVWTALAEAPSESMTVVVTLMTPLGR